MTLTPEMTAQVLIPLALCTLAMCAMAWSVLATNPTEQRLEHLLAEGDIHGVAKVLVLHPGRSKVPGLLQAALPLAELYSSPLNANADNLPQGMDVVIIAAGLHEEARHRSRLNPALERILATGGKVLFLQQP